MKGFASPPQAIRKAKLDNLVLVPASLLPFKAQYQVIANQQPLGTTLVVLPVDDSLPRRALERVVTRMQARGQSVTVLQALAADPGRPGSYCKQVRPLR